MLYAVVAEARRDGVADEFQAQALCLSCGSFE